MTEGCILLNIVVQPWEWLTLFCPEWSCSLAKGALRKGEAFAWMELLWKLQLWRHHVLVPAVLTVQLWIWLAVCVIYIGCLAMYTMKLLILGCVLIKMNSNNIHRKYWSGSCRVCRACSAGTV